MFAILLLGMQLYHVFRMKEDAEEVAKAKRQMDEYAAKMEILTKKSVELEEKIKYLDKHAIETVEDDDSASLLD